MNFHFQERDGEILEAIYKYDGLLARRHINERFFKINPRTGKPIKGSRAMEKRLQKLREEGFVEFPNKDQRRDLPIPETIVWLGWKGAIYIAESHGLFVDHPTKINETALRLLHKRLRKQGLRWMREPRFNQLRHDIAVIDLRMAIEKASDELPGIGVEEWIPESVFRTEKDKVSYMELGRRGEERRVEHEVRPDAYFVILNLHRERAGKPPRARFLLELDNATHPNPRFVNEKVRRFSAYIKSMSFRNRFGDNRCYCLVVCKSEDRLKHLMDKTEKFGGAGARLFLFTAMENLGVYPRQDKAMVGKRSAGPRNGLIDPIWRPVGSEESVSLFTT